VKSSPLLCSLLREEASDCRTNKTIGEAARREAGVTWPSCREDEAEIKEGGSETGPSHF